MGFLFVLTLRGGFAKIRENKKMKNNRPTIYLETSIIAAYFDFWGKSNEQSKVTKDFWQKQMSKYEPIISTITI